MYGDRPPRSPFLDDAARVLKAAEKNTCNLLTYAERQNALERVARGYTDLAAIEQGNLTAEVAADLVAAALKRLGVTAN